MSHTQLKSDIKSYIDELKNFMEEQVFEEAVFDESSQRFEELSKAVKSPSEINQLVEYCKTYIEYVIDYGTFENDLSDIYLKAKLCKYMSALNDLCNVKNLKNVLLKSLGDVVTHVIGNPSVPEICLLELMRFFNSVAQHCNESVRAKVGTTFNFTIYKIVDTLSACESYEYQIIALQVIFQLCSKRISKMSIGMFPGNESLQAAIKAFDLGEFEKSSRNFLNAHNTVYGHIISVFADGVSFEKCSSDALSKAQVFNSHPLWVDFNKRSLGIYCDDRIFFENSSTLKTAGIIKPELVTIFYSSISTIDTISNDPIQLKFNLNGQVYIKCTSEIEITEFKVLRLTFTNTDVSKIMKEIIQFIDQCKTQETLEKSQECILDELHTNAPVPIASLKNSMIESLHDLFGIEYVPNKDKVTKEKSSTSHTVSPKPESFKSNSSFYILGKNGYSDETSYSSTDTALIIIEKNCDDKIVLGNEKESDIDKLTSHRQSHHSNGNLINQVEQKKVAQNIDKNDSKTAATKETKIKKESNNNKDIFNDKNGEIKEIKSTEFNKQNNENPSQENTHLNTDSYKEFKGIFNGESGKTLETVENSIGKEIVSKDIDQSRIASRQQGVNLKSVNESQKPIESSLDNNISSRRMRKSKLKAITFIHSLLKNNKNTKLKETDKKNSKEESNGKLKEILHEKTRNVIPTSIDKYFVDTNLNRNAADPNLELNLKETEEKNSNESQRFKEESQQNQKTIETSADNGISNQRGRKAKSKTITLIHSVTNNKKDTDDLNLQAENSTLIGKGNDTYHSCNVKILDHQVVTKKLPEKEILKILSNGIIASETNTETQKRLPKNPSENTKKRMKKKEEELTENVLSNLNSTSIVSNKRKLFDISVLELSNFKGKKTKNSSKKTKLNGNKRKVQMKPHIPLVKEDKEIEKICNEKRDISDEENNKLTRERSLSCDLFESFYRDEQEEQIAQKKILKVGKEKKNKRSKDMRGRVKTGRVTKRNEDKGNKKKKQTKLFDLNNNSVTVNNRGEQRNVCLKHSEWKASNLSPMDSQVSSRIGRILEEIEDLNSIPDFANLPKWQKCKSMITQFKIKIENYKNV